jgi:hypothetical protein
MQDFATSARKAPVNIDLERLKKTCPVALSEEILLEDSYEAWGADLRLMLQRMFGTSGIPVTITGSPNDVAAFGAVTRTHHDFIRSMKLYGLDDPKLWANRAKLKNAIAEFERGTGIQYPIKV